MTETQAYPLHWPEGWPRTEPSKTERSRFMVTPDRARRGLLDEIRKLVGAGFRRDMVILSTNLRLRQDGEPYSSQRPPEDQGVAVYFEYQGKPMVFACDRWWHIHDNIHAIAKTIEALRGIERWGASDMLERAFTGFQALPGPDAAGGYSWRVVLGVGADCNSLAAAERAYKQLRSRHHPDRGGDPTAFHATNKAIQQARTELS